MIKESYLIDDILIFERVFDGELDKPMRLHQKPAHNHGHHLFSLPCLETPVVEKDKDSTMLVKQENC